MTAKLTVSSVERAESRLRLDHLGAMFGEQGLGLASQMVTGTLEGGLFAAGMVATAW